MGCGASAPAPEKTAEDKALEKLKQIFERTAKLHLGSDGNDKIKWSEYRAAIDEDKELKELLTQSGLKDFASQEVFDKLTGDDALITWEEFSTALQKKKEAKATEQDTGK